MTRNERGEGQGPKDAPEELRLRRVLEAAAARPDELPDPSPFLMTRLRARAAAASAGEAPVPLATLGRLAWRVMPALVLALALLGVWTGVERARASQAADDAAVVTLVEPADLVGEAMGDEPSEEAR
jgi:hypothetical protein